MTCRWCLTLLAVTLIPVEQHCCSPVAAAFRIGTGTQVRASASSSRAALASTSAGKNRRGKIRGSARMATSSDSTLPTQNALAESKGDVDGTQHVWSIAKEGLTLNEGASTVVGAGHSTLGAPDAAAGGEAATITADAPPQAASTSITTAAAAGGEGAATAKEPKRDVHLTDSVDDCAAVAVLSISGKSESGAASPVGGPSSSEGSPSPLEGDSSPGEDDSSPPPGGDNSPVRGGDGADLKAVGLDRDGGLDGGADVGRPPSLAEWLKQGPFALAMAPGFFGYYAHIGALVALEDAGLLEGRVSFATGASGGGLIVGLFAAGLSPRDMGRIAVKFRRADFWDPIGFGGVLRGQKFEALVKNALPEGVERFNQCRVPLAVSAFDVSRLKTRTLAEGSIASALRATCTFPGLFSPVWHPQGVLIDGGVSDSTGMWCLPTGRENSGRVLNVTFAYKGDDKACIPPSRFPIGSNPRPTVEIVTLALTGLPRPHPFAMERGADALEAARSQVTAVLDRPLLPGKEKSHWIAPLQAPKPQTPVSDVDVASGKQSDADQGDLVAGGAVDAREARERNVGMGSGMVPRPSSGRGQAPSEALHRMKRRRTELWSCHSNEGEQLSLEHVGVVGCAEAVNGVKLASLATEEKVPGREGKTAQDMGGMVAIERGGNSEVAPEAVLSAISGAGAGTSTSLRQRELATGVDKSGRRRVEQPAPRKSGRIPKPKVQFPV